MHVMILLLDGQFVIEYKEAASRVELRRVVSKFGRMEGERA